MESVAFRLFFLPARVAVAARLRNRVQMFLPGADGGLDGFLRPVRTQVRFDFHLFGGR